MMPRSRAHAGAGPLRSEADRPSSRRTISTNKAGLVYTRLFRFSGKKVVWCAACFILGVFLPTLFPRYFGGSKAPAALRRVVRTDTFTDDTPCGRLGMMQVIQMPQPPQQMVTMKTANGQLVQVYLYQETKFFND